MERRGHSGLIAGALVAGSLTTLVACSSGSASPTSSQSASAPQPRPSTTAKLAFVSPRNGETVMGSTVDVKVSLQDAQIVPATTTHVVPDQGHLHVYLDNQIVGMNFGLTDKISNVSPGQHVLRVEFVASDHLPFDPRDFVSVVFTVNR